MVEKAKAEATERFAAIRLRGVLGTTASVNDTLRMVHLVRNHSCVVLPKTGQTEGMLKKAKDYITYGEIDDTTFKALVEKRGEPFLGRLTDTKGEIEYGRFIEINGKKLKPYFRLNPPRGGYERKGIKRSFSDGGALGYRGKDINALIMRMI
jgi:large subunit ribosomal protein L30